MEYKEIFMKKQIKIVLNELKQDNKYIGLFNTFSIYSQTLPTVKNVFWVPVHGDIDTAVRFIKIPKKK